MVWILHQKCFAERAGDRSIITSKSFHEFPSSDGVLDSNEPLASGSWGSMIRSKSKRWRAVDFWASSSSVFCPLDEDQTKTLMVRTGDGGVDELADADSTGNSFLLLKSSPLPTNAPLTSLDFKGELSENKEAPIHNMECGVCFTIVKSEPCSRTKASRC